MLNGIIVVGLTFIGIFVAQYSLGMFWRLRQLFWPLTAELRPLIKDPVQLKKLENKQRTEFVMSIVVFFLGPLLVLTYGAEWWALAPYGIGLVVGALMLWGKCGYSERNMYLYFHNYRIYLENELAIRDDPRYQPYMVYRRRSLIEQALDAEEKKRQAEKK